MNSGTLYVPTSPALEEAVAKFNQLFHYQLATPLWPETVAAAVKLSDLRGHPDLAEELRQASVAPSGAATSVTLDPTIKQEVVA